MNVSAFGIGRMACRAASSAAASYRPGRRPGRVAFGAASRYGAKRSRHRERTSAHDGSDPVPSGASAAGSDRSTASSSSSSSLPPPSRAPTVRRTSAAEQVETADRSRAQRRKANAAPDPPQSETWQKPWVQLKSWTYQPSVFARFLGKNSADAQRGDLIAVYAKDGTRFGTGFWNGTARIPLRMAYHGAEPIDEAYLDSLLLRACSLRHELIYGLPSLPAGTPHASGVGSSSGSTDRGVSIGDSRNEYAGPPLAGAQAGDGASEPFHHFVPPASASGQLCFRPTNAYRVVNSDGDGLNGLIVDRYADALSVEVTSFAAWRRLPRWLPLLHRRLGTRRHRLTVDADVAQLESIPNARMATHVPSDPVRTVRITENGLHFDVDLETGHKTGFFCDQRDNRARLAAFTRGQDVLDLCCYTGGFALSAAVHGGAASVTGVDLDEVSVAQARHNAALNGRPATGAAALHSALRFVHADAFRYGRQMVAAGRRYGVVVLDPPKLVAARDGAAAAQGRRTYEDLNALAVSLVRRGGLLLTCSCSGLLSAAEFTQLVVRAAHRAQRRLQFVHSSGAGVDHPVMSNALEGAYLKALWARVL